MLRMLCYLLMTVLAIIGVRAIAQYIKDWFNVWRIVPLLIVGFMLLDCGVAQAGVIGAGHIVPDFGLLKPALWQVVQIIVIVIITIFS
jgi:hypothetical protein